MVRGAVRAPDAAGGRRVARWRHSERVAQLPRRGQSPSAHLEAQSGTLRMQCWVRGGLESQPH
eukprot:9635204-Prorocentrum_lima.AAC.1